MASARFFCHVLDASLPISRTGIFFSVSAVFVSSACSITCSKTARLLVTNTADSGGAWRKRRAQAAILSVVIRIPGSSKPVGPASPPKPFSPFRFLNNFSSITSNFSKLISISSCWASNSWAIWRNIRAFTNGSEALSGFFFCCFLIASRIPEGDVSSKNGMEPFLIFKNASPSFWCISAHCL